MSETMARPGFLEVTIEQLEAAPAAALDVLAFGIIGMAADGSVVVYNQTESTLAGLSKGRVLGRNFFAEIGICMNNYLVAQRFIDAATLDETLPYVLTLRMRPTPVTLRLLKSPDWARSYILVQR